MNYDVTADGKCFLIDTPAGPGAASSPPLKRRGELECGAEKIGRS